MVQDRLHMPVFVTGIERSGISIIAKIISICGGFTGKCSEMYENHQVKLLVDDYYNKCGVNPNGQYPLLDTEQMLIPTDWNKRVEDVLFDEDYEKKQLWVYKGSRISQIWPVWNYAFPNARWIIVRRRTGDIIQSCLKTAYMNAFADKNIQKLIGVDNEHDGWLWWVHKHEKNFVEMIERGLNCKQIWPERMINGDYQQVFEMLDWIGLEWKPEVVELIGPMLWNNRKKKGVK